MPSFSTVPALSDAAPDVPVGFQQTPLTSFLISVLTRSLVACSLKFSTGSVLSSSVLNAVASGCGYRLRQTQPVCHPQRPRQNGNNNRFCCRVRRPAPTSFGKGDVVRAALSCLGLCFLFRPLGGFRFWTRFRLKRFDFFSHGAVLFVEGWDCVH